jgi:hypothetical protein
MATKATKAQLEEANKLLQIKIGTTIKKNEALMTLTEYPRHIVGVLPNQDTAMKDMLTVLLLVFVVIGLWMALYVFAAVAGAGLAIIFLYHWIKEFRELN